MDVNPRIELSRKDHHFIKKSVIHSCILLLFIVAAFGIRLYHINRPPLDFAPIRQYQSAHIARGLYFETNKSISESKKLIAKTNMERMGFLLEPRIMEQSAVFGYRIMDSEHLWLPRTLSSIFWMIGGIFLFFTARMIFSSGVALFTVFFYLFLPFGVLASRSFQPDPLMVMMMTVSIFFVLKYNDNPSMSNLMIAAFIAAGAVLIKPYCVFIIFGAFFSLAALRRGFWKASLHRDTILFAFVMTLPGFFYYGYGMLTSVGFLEYHAQGSFLPHLIINSSFWGGWFLMIGRVVGFVAFFFALAGLIKIERLASEFLLLGLWVGYFVFGLSATYQIHTHDYYSLPLVPIVALSLGPIAATVIDRGASLLSGHYKKLVFLCLIIIAIPALLIPGKTSLKNIISEHKNKLRVASVLLGLTPEFRKFLIDDFQNEVRISREIGEHVGHSINTVFLTPYFGRVIAYHGDMAGYPWPTSLSLNKRRLRGEPVPNIKRDFTSKHIELLYQGKLIRHVPDFFVITAFDEFDTQDELKKFLFSNFPVLIQNSDYLIFDLRKMSE